MRHTEIVVADLLSKVLFFFRIANAGKHLQLFGYGIADLRIGGVAAGFLPVIEGYRRAQALYDDQVRQVAGIFRKVVQATNPFQRAARAHQLQFLAELVVVLIVNVTRIVQCAVVAVAPEECFGLAVAGDRLELQCVVHLPGVGPGNPHALNVVVGQRAFNAGYIDVGVRRAAGVVGVQLVPQVTKQGAVLPCQHHVGVAGLVLLVPVHGQGGLEAVGGRPVEDGACGRQVDIAGIVAGPFLPAVCLAPQVGDAA